MASLLLSLHVVAGILFVGPVAVAASLFPRYAPVTASVTTSVGAPASAPARGPGPSRQAERSPDTARLLHRITRVYGVLAVTVPVVGIALAVVQDRTTEVWVVVAMVLTAVAGGLLVLQISPRQSVALSAPDSGAQLRRLGMLTGVFNLLWTAVVVLMIVRPWSGQA